MEKIIQCVPNFSEGRDPDKVEKIVDCFRGQTGVKLLDYSSDADHNRSVVTLVGEPSGLKETVVAAIGKAQQLIDMNKHQGQHPRMGAVDVIPFIPIRGCDIQECDQLAKEVAGLAFERFKHPFFLYEKSAGTANRENLAKIRKGEFEGMAEKTRKPEWKPDFGDAPHPTSGITAIGARMPLVAYNVKLDTNRLEIADAIAKKVRHIGGGLRFVKGIGVDLADRGIVEVSMNLTDFSRSTIYAAFEMVKMEAARYGVNILGSEIIGLVPMAALIESAEYYLGLENFNIDQVLETRL